MVEVVFASSYTPSAGESARAFVPVLQLVEENRRIGHRCRVKLVATSFVCRSHCSLLALVQGTLAKADGDTIPQLRMCLAFRQLGSYTAAEGVAKGLDDCGG